MPFVAETAGGLVVPEEVDADARLTCRECGDELRVRQSHERGETFVARHFYHPGGGECSGGESDIHRRMKSIALSKVKQLFPYDEAGLEKKIGSNIADVYASFDEPIGKFGDGVVVEIQHRNDDKDIGETSVKYLMNGFSVCWISTQELDGQNIDLTAPDWRYAGEFDKRPDPRSPGPKSLENPTCDGCLTETLEPVQKEHAHRSGQVYQCTQCGFHYIEASSGLERVAHETHISSTESRPFW